MFVSRKTNGWQLREDGKDAGAFIFFRMAYRLYVRVIGCHQWMTKIHWKNCVLATA